MLKKIISKKNLTIILFFCIFSKNLFPQQIPESQYYKYTNEELEKRLTQIKIDELVMGTLSEVLDRFSKRYELLFSFDRKALDKIKINERPFEAPMNNYLKVTLGEHRLKYVFYESMIYVIPKSNTLEQVLRKDAVRKTNPYAQNAIVGNLNPNPANNNVVGNNLNVKDSTNKISNHNNQSIHQINQNLVPKKFNFTITGKVKDAETGETLPFSTVVVKGSTKGTTANADGYFILQNVPTDTSTIVGQYMGYQDLTIRLLPHLSNENIVLDLVSAGSVEGEEVVIQGEREDLMQTNPQDISVIRLTPRSLERLPNVGEKDIMRSFQLMPGISASNESSSGLYVRGGTPDQNLIVYDGFTVYHVDHLYGFFSAFNSNALKDVQLYKGGFDSRFGGRLASVTEITGKDGNQKQFNMGGDVSLLSMNVFAEIPIGDKFSSVFAYRRSYKGFLYNTIVDRFNQNNNNNNNSNQAQATSLPNTNQTKATSYFYDLNGKMTYRFSDNHSLVWSIYNGTDKLDNGYKIETPSFLARQGANLDFSIGDLTRYGNVGSSLKWTQRWSPKFYGNVLVSYSNYYSERNRTNNSTVTLSSGESRKINFGTIEDNNLKDYSLKMDYQWDIHSKHQIQFGTMLTNYDIKYSYSQNDTTTIISKDNQGKTYSFYAQDRMKLWDNRLLITAGARTTYFDVTQKNYIEPRLNATYQLNKKIILKGAWGKYYQFANRVLREDILAGSRDFWILSNDSNIPVSSSVHYIAGLAYNTQKYLLSAEAYHKDLDGISEYSLRFDGSPTGTKYTENFYNGRGYSQGVELLAQKKSGKWTGWLSYTLGQVKHQFDVYGKNYFSALNDVTHEFKAVGIYQWRRFDFSLTWIYATGRPYTAPAGGYNIELLDGTSQTYFSVTDKNALRLPDYHRLDFAMNYRLQNEEGGDIGYIGLSFFNMYNRTNTWYKQFQIIENQITATNVNYLGFTPNLTLSLKLR